GLYDADLPRAAAGAVPDPAAVPDGRVRRAGGWPGAPGHPPLRRGARVRVRLSPRPGQPDPAGGTPVGDLPGATGQHEPAADPAAQRRTARRGGVHCGGDIQEVPVRTREWRIRVTSLRSWP